MRCPQCGTVLRDGTEVCETCGATIPPLPSFAPATGQADPWAGSEPFMAGLPDPWDDQAAAPRAGATPHTLGDLFDPAAPPPPPPPMRAPKQGALPPVNRGNPGMGRPMSTPAPAWPDTSGGGGVGSFGDANLPAWLFDRPQGWQAPDSAAGGLMDPWDPSPAPPAAAMPSNHDQGLAWPDSAPTTGGWDRPAAPVGRSPGTPRSPLAGRGPATPLRQLGQMGQMLPPQVGWDDVVEPPPPPPAPTWKRPPAPPSAPLGDAWPSVVAPQPNTRDGKRGWRGLSLPFKLGRGGGRTAGPRQSAASRRLGGGVAQPTAGHGWHIVTPLNPPDQPQPFSYLAPAAPRRPSRGIAVIAGFSRWTFNLLLVGIIVAILAIPISIGLSRLAAQHPPVVATHPTATPRAIPAPPSGYQQLLINALAIDYPAAWKHGTFSMTLDAAGTVQGNIYANSDHAAFAVSAIQAIPANTLQQILNMGLLPLNTEPTDSFSPIVTPQLGPTLDVVRWQYEEYTFNLVTGQTTIRMHAVALVANRGAYTYIIVYQAPDGQFASLQSQYFQPMLDSFRFRP